MRWHSARAAVLQPARNHWPVGKALHRQDQDHHRTDPIAVQKADQWIGAGCGQFAFQLVALGRGEGLLPILAQPVIQWPQRADFPGVGKYRRRGRRCGARSIGRVALG